MKDNSRPYRYCGRDFSGEELQKIRQLIASDDQPNRVTISRRVCDVFGWFKSAFSSGCRILDLTARTGLRYRRISNQIQFPQADFPSCL